MPYKNKVDQKKRNQRYYLENKEKLLQGSKEYHKKHRKDILTRQKKWRTEHREQNKNNCRNYYYNNKVKLNKQNRERHKKNRTANLEAMNKYREKNKEKLKAQCRAYGKTENGKKASAKHHNKRKRELGFNIIFENKIVGSINWHHVNNKDVVALPIDLHTLYGGGNGNTESHRQNLEPIVVQLYPEYGVDNV